MKIFLSNDQEIIKLIKKDFIEFNKVFLGTYETKNLVIYAKENDQIIGGIICKLIKDFIFLEIVWVSEEYRSKDVGTNLYGKLEEYAYKNNYSSIQAESLSFQNHNFYKKLGFIQVGFIKEWNQGFDSYFMKKIL